MKKETIIRSAAAGGLMLGAACSASNKDSDIGTGLSPTSSDVENVIGTEAGDEAIAGLAADTQEPREFDVANPPLESVTVPAPATQESVSPEVVAKIAEIDVNNQRIFDEQLTLGPRTSFQLQNLLSTQAQNHIDINPSKGFTPEFTGTSEQFEAIAKWIAWNQYMAWRSWPLASEPAPYNLDKGGMQKISDDRREITSDITFEEWVNRVRSEEFTHEELTVWLPDQSFGVRNVEGSVRYIPVRIDQLNIRLVSENDIPNSTAIEWGLTRDPETGHQFTLETGRYIVGLDPTGEQTVSLVVGNGYTDLSLAIMSLLNVSTFSFARPSIANLSPNSRFPWISGQTDFNSERELYETTFSQIFGITEPSSFTEFGNAFSTSS